MTTPANVARLAAALAVYHGQTGIPGAIHTVEQAREHWHEFAEDAEGILAADPTLMDGDLAERDTLLALLADIENALSSPFLEPVRPGPILGKIVAFRALQAGRALAAKVADDEAGKP